jgi:hypothetical protein
MEAILKLADDLARALDPCSLMTDCGMTPDGWQRELLTEIPDRALLNCCRQSGKSTTAAILALHVALFEPHALILVISPSLRQSGELFRKVSGFYHALGEDAEQSTMESALRLEMKSGSRIISLPASEGTIRGYSSATLVIVDEGARVSDELMAAVRPTLATTRGKLVAMSTPWGRRGWFWKEWEHGGEQWRRFTLRAEDCQRISKEFLDEERRSLGPFLFQQEYECEFLDAETSIFSSALIEAALSDEVAPLWK